MTFGVGVANWVSNLHVEYQQAVGDEEIRIFSGGLSLSLYQTLNKSLETVLGDRTRMVLEEGVRRLGVNPDNLDYSQAEVILKRLVYRELQSKMAPAAARAKIEEVLNSLGKDDPAPIAEAKADVAHDAIIVQDLEVGLKRFSMYLDWPEAGRLRALLHVIKQDPDTSTIKSLLREGQDVLATLEEKLQGALLRQSKDIADLQVSLERVQSVGGPKAKRLKTLLDQIEEAHGQETLAIAEVERARSIAAEMRKLVASSVVQSPPEVAITVEDEDPDHIVTAAEPDSLDGSPAQVGDGFELDIGIPHDAKSTSEVENPTIDLVIEDSTLELDLDFNTLTMEQQIRFKEIDLAEEQRHLDLLREKYAVALSKKEMALQFTNLQDELSFVGEPLGEALPEFEEKLKAVFIEMLAEARVRFELLNSRLTNIKIRPARFANVMTHVAVASETLQSGGIPQELAQLESTVTALEAEEKAILEQQQRAAKLLQQIQSVKAEAKASLEAFKGNPQVDEFIAGFDSLEPTESNLQFVRQQLGVFLTDLAKAKEQEGLRRMGLKAKAEAIPLLKGLESEKAKLSAQLDTAPLAQIETAIATLITHSRAHVVEELSKIESEIEKNKLEGFADPLVAKLAEARKSLEAGQIFDPSLLAGFLEQAFGAKREAVLDEISRLDTGGRALRGLGGEELESAAAKLRSEVEAGKFPSLDHANQLLASLRRNQEALRLDLESRINALLGNYDVHKSVGGDTAQSLKSSCDFLESGLPRLSRLGASGLVEVRRALEGAEKMAEQLAQEYEAAKSLMSELGAVDIDAFLDVFDGPKAAEVAPPPTPVEPVSAPVEASVAPVAAAMPTSANPTVKVDLGNLESLLPALQMRGVEAVALVKDGAIAWGSLPLSSRSAGTFFEELTGLSSELFSSPAQLSVITLAKSVMVMVPLGDKGLTILAEKALLSRLLAQVDKLRDAIA